MSDDDLPKLGAPAARALASIGVTRLGQLADHRADELLALHGFGPRALYILDEQYQPGAQVGDQERKAAEVEGLFKQRLAGRRYKTTIR